MFINKKKLLGTVVVAFFAATTAASAAPDFGGVWVLYNAEKFGKPALTGAGLAFKESYNFKQDDPALKCIPASWTRIYSNPNTPFEITQNDDSIEIRYELFDVERTVPLTKKSGPFEHTPNNPDLPTLGDSVAWYDGEELLIHTNNYGDETRVLSTIRGWAGTPQSPLMVTLERYWLNEGSLMVEVTHFDPLMYDEPLVVVYPFTLEPEYEVEYYGCEPEAASVLTISEDEG
jgi:hypothetical protein